ncbi:MAG: hypothetical protein ACE5HV_05230, partial [Acidobacteriota bacterium]
QGRVAFGIGGEAGSLDHVLASLPVLHHGLRWLADLPGSGRSSLSAVPKAACAAAAVAAETMATSLPPAWTVPDVITFCGSGS